MSNLFMLNLSRVKSKKIFFYSFVSDIQLMHTTEANLNEIFVAFEEFIINYESFIKNLTPNHLENEFGNIFASGTEFVIEKLNSLN